MSSQTVAPAQVQTADITSPIVQSGEVQPVVASPIVEVTPRVSEPEAPKVEPVITAVDPKTTPEWAQKRINELTAKRHEAERLADQSRNENVALKKANEELLARMAGGTTPPAQTTAAKSDEEINRLAEEKAKQISAANEFNKACNTIVEAGKKQFTDWDEAIKNLNLVGAIGKDVSPEFLETAIELKNPSQVLHHLGKNLEEAERIAKLSPKRMALELARVEASLNTPAPPPPVSNAPAPLVPIAGAAKASSTDISDPSISMEEFHSLRNKQMEERRNRYRRV